MRKQSVPKTCQTVREESKSLPPRHGELRIGKGKKGEKGRLSFLCPCNVTMAARSFLEHSTVVSTVNSALGSPHVTQQGEKEAVHCNVTVQVIRDSDKLGNSWVSLYVATCGPMVCAPNWS